MTRFQFPNKKLTITVLISLSAVLLFIAHSVLAKQTPLPASLSVQGINEPNGNNNDFDNDVQEGNNELNKNSEAQKLQKEVVDGEDQQAGDEENNNIHEDSSLQESNNQQKVDEADQNNNNSEIDEVNDSNNLDQQSQDVIDEHQQEQDREDQQGNQQDSEQNQVETSDTNQESNQ